MNFSEIININPHSYYYYECKKHKVQFIVNQKNRDPHRPLLSVFPIIERWGIVEFLCLFHILQTAQPRDNEFFIRLFLIFAEEGIFYKLLPFWE